jgi:catechol 2,3-dioxygenase-like lactoylglutathione lyase family enzyme
MNLRFPFRYTSDIKRIANICSKGRTMAQLEYVGMVVRDMVASLKFYRLLGLDIPAGAETEAHVEYSPVPGFRVAWDTEELIKGIDADWVEPVGQRIGLGVKCANAAEVDTLYKRVTENGYHGYKAPWDAFWGQRYAIVTDPDGNHVDLFAGL